MYLCGFSLDNLSLMALAIASGFVVDDAIVVMENITRHLEAGMTPIEAALQGAQEIGFTVFSISVSLIAVFIPLLLMGGIIGRLFREFAITLSSRHPGVDAGLAHNNADDVLARPDTRKRHQTRKNVQLERARLRRAYSAAIGAASTGCSTIPRCILVIFVVTLGLECFPARAASPKDFSRMQDTGAVQGGMQGPQDTSFSCHANRPSGRRSTSSRPIPAWRTSWALPAAAGPPIPARVHCPQASQ